MAFQDTAIIKKDDFYSLYQILKCIKIKLVTKIIHELQGKRHTHISEGNRDELWTSSTGFIVYEIIRVYCKERLAILFAIIKFPKPIKVGTFF